MMDEQMRELRELVEDNNKILHRMQSAARWGRFLHVIYWLLILGVFGASYYFLQPFIEVGRQTFDQLGNNVDALKKLPDAINNLLRQLPQ